MTITEARDILRELEIIARDTPQVRIIKNRKPADGILVTTPTGYRMNLHSFKNKDVASITTDERWNTTIITLN